MKRSFLIISIGVIAAFGVQSWYVQQNALCQEDSLECNLSWMKEYLSLSDEQYSAVLAMHLNHEDEIVQLTDKITLLQERLDELENERINNDSIDFIAFYNYLQEKTSLNESFEDNTQDFLSDVGSLMTTEQNQRFKNLLSDFKNSST